MVDDETEKAYPLCFKSDCLHNEETDPERIPNCNAFIGTPINAQFLCVYHNKLYCTVKTNSKGTADLIEMELDGSNRKTIISDLDHIQAGSLVFHRGVFYYISTYVSLEGEVTNYFTAYSIAGNNRKPVVLEEYGQDITLSQFFPLGNNIFYTKTKVVDERPVNESYRYNIQTCQSEILPKNMTDGLMNSVISGGYNGTLIIEGTYGEARSLREYDAESLEPIQSKTKGLNSFVQDHLDWGISVIHADKDILFIQCIDLQNMERKSDLYIVSREDGTMTILPDEAWDNNSIVEVIYEGEPFYLKKTKSCTPFSVNAYRKSDLLSGKTANPVSVLSADDFSASFLPAYILPYDGDFPE